MRDAIAGIVAFALLVVAASLGTTLPFYRKRRQRVRDAARASGRRLVAEIPAADDRVLFTEDATRFYYGKRAIDKDQVVAVRVLINGAPIATIASSRAPSRAETAAFEDRPDGIARDRWDVAIETASET